VHGDLAPRLALQTILQAGGYSVDVAASPAEAMFKLDEGRYELVLTDQRLSASVRAYARVKEYRPATAVVNASALDDEASEEPLVSVRTEGVPMLLEDVAELIGARARRRYRPMSA
jgi:CheY-like chemotaxis protein